MASDIRLIDYYLNTVKVIIAITVDFAGAQTGTHNVQMYFYCCHSFVMNILNCNDTFKSVQSSVLCDIVYRGRILFCCTALRIIWLNANLLRHLIITVLLHVLFMQNYRKSLAIKLFCNFLNAIRGGFLVHLIFSTFGFWYLDHMSLK